MEFNISELENKMVESVNEIYKDTDDSKIGFKEKFEIEESKITLDSNIVTDLDLDSIILRL